MVQKVSFPVPAVYFFFTVLFSLPLTGGFAQDLSIHPGDIRVVQSAEGGCHLYIRKKTGIASVLITETTRDPALMADNYAYRASEWNAVNGSETRVLDGTVIPAAARVYSLIDSTPEAHPELGQAFHIYIPYVLYYGYTDTRHGEVYVVDGTYLNLRAFALPYGDYRGSFQDNPYILKVMQQEPSSGMYMKDTVEAFSEISRSGGGELVYSSGPDDLVERIRSILAPEAGKSLDLVICLDTTNSMKDDIDAVRRELIGMLEEIPGGFTDFRIGLVLYKDYHDEYLNRVIPFTRDFEAVRRSLNSIRVSGGRDIPEAVYEALYEGAVKFPWEAESRIMILVGDAPPHPRPRGRITREMVDREVASRNLRLNAIILPQ